jgi:hypothetical protein
MRNIIPALCLALLIGCATAPKMNRLSLGMTKEEVISVMGKPASTSSAGESVELLHYHLSPTGGPILHLITEEYFVKMLSGKVVAYGTMRDLDSTKDAATKMNTNDK